MGAPRGPRAANGTAHHDATQPLWVRVGGGLVEVPGGRRHGPADRALPPPGGPWEELCWNGRLVGWAPPGVQGRAAARRAVEDGERIAAERRAWLVRRLGHKLRSSVLALQVSSRRAAFGGEETLEEVYEQAGDVGQRALALETVALDPPDPPRAVVIGAALNLAANGARSLLPADAVVHAPEPALREAFHRASQWMGEDCTVTGERAGSWWRIEFLAGAVREPLEVPELGEPLVRHMVDTVLEGWLDAPDPNHLVMYLPAAA